MNDPVNYAADWESSSKKKTQNKYSMIDNLVNLLGLFMMDNLSIPWYFLSVIIQIAMRLSMIGEQMIKIAAKSDEKEVARGKSWKNKIFSYNLVILKTEGKDWDLTQVCYI